jgi:outer membrane biosynthesis protein TonB
MPSDFLTHMRRKGPLLLLVILCAFALLARATGGPPAPGAVEAPGVKAPSTRDSTDSFVPLARRPKPTGLLISSLVRGGGRLWAVGDSGLVASSQDDSTFSQVPTGTRLAFQCADWSDGALVCAGDSGRVIRVSGSKVLTRAGVDGRTVRDVSMSGSMGLLGGDEGLLAWSSDGGRSWRECEAPLPMRFSAVLIHGDEWWAAGAGGRIYRSPDRGAHWLLASRAPASIVDLEAALGKSVVALDCDGGLRQVSAIGERSLGDLSLDAASLPVRCTDLVPVEGGWMVSGDGALLARLDTLGGQWTRLSAAPSSTTLTAMVNAGSGIIAAGSWSSVFVWSLGDPAPRQLTRFLEPEIKEVRADDAGLAARDSSAPLNSPSTTADSLTQVQAATTPTSAPSGRRFYQNALDTEIRCSTPPTRMRQLERSYNGTRWLGISGSALVVLDISSAGSLDSAFVVDEWPSGLGIGAQALDLAKSLTFTPGFRGASAVPGRMLMPITFPQVDADFQSWAKGDGQAGAVIDSLCALLPRAKVDMDPKALVKLMDFPRKAKRYTWEGQAVVEYHMGANGEMSRGRVLWDSEPKFAFGEHALEISAKVKLGLPAELVPAAGDHLRVVQRFVFDRKRYDRARKEAGRGFEFAPVLLSVVEADSSRFDPGLQQLEWLLNDFSGSDSAKVWPELDMTVVLRQNGTPFSVAMRPMGTETPPDAATLQSLALSFTWGHPAKADVDDLDTLVVKWRPRGFRADSSNCPSQLAKVLHGVAY